MLIIGRVAYTMIGETRLPYRRTTVQPIRKTSFDELNGPLQRNLRGRRDQQMQVIGHDHEFMQKEFPFVAIMRERFDQELGSCLLPKDWKALGGNGSDEEYAVGVHLAMVAGWERVVCERCHNLRRGIPKRYTGPKGRFFLSACNAALEGPLFHGIAGDIARRKSAAGIG